MARTLPSPIENMPPIAPDLATLGLLLRNRRLEQGMRIDDAAALLGISTSVLSRLENGKPVGTNRLMSVIDGLGVNLFLVVKEDAFKALRALSPHGEAPAQEPKQ